MKRALRGLRIGAMAASLALGVQMFGSLAIGPGADAHSGAVKATTRVHVRTQPTTQSKSLTILSPGQQVTAAGTTDGWTKVTWNGQTAYVYAKYLTATSDSTRVDGSALPSNSYTTANLNVRSGPSLRHSVVAVASKGTVMSLTGRISGAYTQVVWKGVERWVATAYLSVNTPDPAKPRPVTSGSMQTTANLNIRTGASTSFRSVGVVPRGTILPITGKTSNGFHEVIWQGNSRWASSRYLRTVGDSSTVTPPSTSLPATTDRWATANLNIWAASSGTRYNGEIPKGSKLAVTGKIENGRAEIVLNGALRWVTARYTTTVDPTASGGVGSGTGSWDLTSPPITGGPRGTDLNRGYSSGLERTNPYIQRIAADVWHRFPEIKTQYGWRRDVTPDHPAGRAVDVMIPNYRNNKALGNAIAEYYRKHARELNISYIIWDQKIWSVARSSEGWRHMANRGNDTANHLDHVHINSN